MAQLTDAARIQILEAALGAVMEERDTVRMELHTEKQVSAAIDSSWTPLQPVPPQLVASIRAFIEEYHRAKAKHGEMTMDGTMSGDAIRDDALRLAALVEEVGEVAHELTYDQALMDEAGLVEGGQLGRLQKELIQVANVALTWHSYLVPGPTIPGPQTSAGRTLNVTVAEGAGWRLGGAVEAVGAGNTVRVPDGLFAVLVPEDKLQTVVNAVLDPRS